MANNTKYDLSRVPRELFEQYIRTHTSITGEQILYPPDLGAQIRKAAEVPLRTKAEVDADIAAAVRKYANSHKGRTHPDADESLFLMRAYYEDNGEIVTIDRDVKELLAEETSD